MGLPMQKYSMDDLTEVVLRNDHDHFDILLYAVIRAPVHSAKSPKTPSHAPNPIHEHRHRRRLKMHLKVCGLYVIFRLHLGLILKRWVAGSSFGHL